VITLEDWALIRRLHVGEGVPKAVIARQLGISRNTVAKALESSSPPKYERPLAGTAFDAVEGQVRQLLAQTPSMPATVLAERIGWAGSPSWFREQVRRVRPDYAPNDPADRLQYHPGDQVQCDLWFPPTLISLGDRQAGSPPVLVMVPSFSRFITAVMLPSRTTPDLLAGMWFLLSQQLGAVPHRLIWDNEAGIGRRNHLATGVTEFVGALATRIVQLKPFDPESKGIVERANQFLETSFMPGRTFTSPQDFNDQLAAWLPKANGRTVRSLKARPVDLIDQDRARMLAMPPVAPFVGFSHRIRLPRDYYVRVLSNDYSVDPAAIGRMVDIRANLDRVEIVQGSRVVGSHQRCWSTGATITDPVHVAAAAALRTVFQTPRPQTNSAEMTRDLADYDTAFGVEFTTEVAS
jgi:transposase